MESLFSLSHTLPHDSAIDRWLKRADDELHSIAGAWFQEIRHCGEDVREILHDKRPTACIGKFPFAYVDVHKAHVNVGFFQGADLADPSGILMGTGKRMRHIKLTPSVQPQARAIIELIQEAYRNIRKQLDKKGLN